VWALLVCFAAGVLPVRRDSVTGLLEWSAASFALCCGGIAAVFMPELRSRLAFSTALNWSGLVAGSIAVGSAYAVQKARRIRRPASWHPAWAFGATAVAWSWLPPLAAVVPFTIWAITRREGSTGPADGELQQTTPAHATEPRR
jgi:hypothetical protein